MTSHDLKKSTSQILTKKQADINFKNHFVKLISKKKDGLKVFVPSSVFCSAEIGAKGLLGY